MFGFNTCVKEKRVSVACAFPVFSSLIVNLSVNYKSGKNDEKNSM